MSSTHSNVPVLYVLKEESCDNHEVRVSYLDPNACEDYDNFLANSFVVFSSKDEIKRDANCNIFTNILQAAGIKIIYR